MFRSTKEIAYFLRRSSKWILLMMLALLLYSLYLLFWFGTPSPLPVTPLEQTPPSEVSKQKAEKKSVAHPSKKVLKTAPLARPENLRGTDGDSGKITLLWEPSKGALSYEVYRQDNSQEPFKLIAKDIQTSVYADTSVQSHRHYFYKVKALNESQSSPMSAAEEAFATGEKVEAVKASQGDYITTIKVSWANTENRSYNVYRSAKPLGKYTLIGKAVSKDHYVDENITSCSNYYYKVSGVDALGESPLGPWAGGYTKCKASVKNFAGSGKMGAKNAKHLLEASFNRPVGLAFDKGTLYIADSFNHQIRSINAKGNMRTLIDHRSNDKKRLYRPTGLAVDSHGNIFTTEVDNHIIRKISPSGKMTVFAGNGRIGDKDGIGINARFNKPYQMIIDAKDNLYVTEFGNHKIRKISPQARVETFAGEGQSGKRDGSRLYARFDQPTGIVLDSHGTIFVADGNNHNIRRITIDGKVHTFAGNTQSGDKDGRGVLANFRDPRGLAIDKKDNLYVADTGNHKIRMISPDGTVKTLAGSLQKGDSEGLGRDARFFSPRGIVVDDAGFIYVTDFHTHKIKRIKLQK